MVPGKLFSVAVAGFITMLASAQVFAQADVIEQRQKLMKSNSADAKAIKAAVESKDYATIETKAREIAGNAGKIVGLFPKGSDKGKTKATAAIWEKPDEFSKDAKSLAKAASELAAAAKAKDDDAIAVKVKAVSEACGSCHKPSVLKVTPSNQSKLSYHSTRKGKPSPLMVGAFLFPPAVIVFDVTKAPPGRTV